MKTRMERMEEAMAVAIKALGDISDNTVTAQYALEQIQSLLSPTVEREEEVVRWAWGEAFETYSSEEKAIAHAAEGKTVYKLTGTRKRTVRLVEKSVSVEATVLGSGVVMDLSGERRPFVNFPDAHGRRVTLTATWHEEEDI